jgi:hypothetical protein
MKMTREFMEVGENLYEILRRIREDSRPVIDTWKEHLMADKVFRKEGWLYFCRSVEEAVIVPDEKVKKIKNANNDDIDRVRSVDKDPEQGETSDGEAES